MPPNDRPPAATPPALSGLRRTGRIHLSPEATEARVLVVGQAVDLHRALTHPAVESGRLCVVGTFAVDIEVGLSPEERRAIERRFEALEADALLLAGPVGPSLSNWAADVVMAHDVPLWAVMPTEVAADADPRIVWTGNEPLLQLAGYHRSPVALAAKRTLDIAGAVVGLALTVPVIAVVSLFIVLESPGAPIFRHTRISLNGRRFGCLKLRTMYADAEERLENDSALYDDYLANNYKIPEERDPRITPLGRFLRRTSFDELPQFWNVLIGDMSLVGPRPVVPTELEHYQGARRRLLLTLRPGLTGAWAVSGRHGLGYPERAEVELSYVRRWSLRADLIVLVRTLRAVLSY